MTARDKEILQQIAIKVRNVAPKSASVYLYGSRARGDNRKDSDWDLLILLDKETITLSDIDEVAYPIREMGWALGADINPILYTKKEWKESSFTPFYKNVTEDSITL